MIGGGGDATERRGPNLTPQRQAELMSGPHSGPRAASTAASTAASAAASPLPSGSAAVGLRSRGHTAIREHLPAPCHRHALVDTTHRRALLAEVDDTGGARAGAKRRARRLLVHDGRLEAESRRLEQHREHLRAEAPVEEVGHGQDDTAGAQLSLGEAKAGLPATAEDGTPPDLLQRGEDGPLGAARVRADLTQEGTEPSVGEEGMARGTKGGMVRRACRMATGSREGMPHGHGQ